MTCIICNGPTSLFFTKTYIGKAAPFMSDIGPCEFRRCEDCGFVLSQTHADLSALRWENLNHNWHGFLEKLDTGIKQPPYQKQAAMLNALGEHGIIDTENWLDYAAGRGTLSGILGERFGIILPIHDAYCATHRVFPYLPEEALTTYRTVINSAMFEHIRCREDLDRVNRLVADDGCLIVHTLVSENVPCNPRWHYLEPPVHCALHTNKSMGVLMKQWGYDRSMYVHSARCWVLFKQYEEGRLEKIKAMAAASPHDKIGYQNGFVPYR